MASELLDGEQGTGGIAASTRLTLGDCSFRRRAAAIQRAGFESSEPGREDAVVGRVH
jgi:hypothetical protein